MKTSRPDIIVTSPDGEYLMIVEVTLNERNLDSAVEQVKYLMGDFDCSVGLVVAGDQIVLLRDSLEKYNGASAHIVGQAKLPNFLLPPADEQWKINRTRNEFQFGLRVQRWLEQLKHNANIDNFPDDLKALLGNQIINLLSFGEVRSGGPRRSNVAK
jgi:hypothetical protein